MWHAQVALNLQYNRIVLHENGCGLSNGGLGTCHSLGQGSMGSSERC